MLSTIISLIVLLLLVLLALLALFLLAAAYARQRNQDRTLRAFEGYFVTVERSNGRIWSGILALTTTGFELTYPTAGGDTNPPAEASYIHYAVEYDALQALYRDIEAMSPEERKRRDADLRAELKPGKWQQRRRRADAWLEHLLDTLEEGISVLTDREQVPVAVEMEGVVLGGQNDHRFLVGYKGNRFDPLLERNRGQRVVCQLVAQNALFERIGTLQSYSRQFLLLTDVLYPSERVIYFAREEIDSVEAEVRMVRQGRRLEIANLSMYPLLLDSLRMGDNVKELGMVLDPEQSFDLVLDFSEGRECELRCQVVRQLDLIIPRKHALVRYRPGSEESNQLFDIGIALAPPPDDLTEQEERLRWELRQHPRNAGAAASLGRLLFRKGDLVEAERCFQVALENQQALPDNGKRVSQELAQLRKHRDRLLEA